MKNSLKLLLLSLVGIIALTSITYSYDLVESNQYPRWNPANKSTDRSLLCYGLSYKNIYSSNGSCSSSDPLLLSGSFYTAESFQFYKDIGYYGLNTAKNGEGLDIYYSQWNNQTRKQSYKIFSIPSRAGYQYTNTIGNSFVFTKMFFYPFQFTFYDPETRYSVSFLNKMKLENIILLSDPSRDDNNVRMINLQKLKAWSRSASRSEASKILIGDITPADIKAMQWTTSYTMVEGGGSFHPPLFRVDKQGSAGWIYTEDFELDTNIWNTGGSNTPSQPNNGGNTNQSYDQSLAEYNQCVDKYTKIKAMTAHSDGCFGTNLDNDERQTYWYNVIDGNDSQYNTWDKIRYWRCWQFADYKAKTKKALGESRDPFWKEWKNNYLGLEAKDVDIPALCGLKPQKQSGTSPEYSYFAGSGFRNVFIDAWDWFRGRRGDPAKISGSGEKLYDVDFTEEYGLLRSEYWKCNGFDSLGIKQIYYTDQEIAANCNTYQQSKAKLLSKWDGAKLGKIYGGNVQNALTKLEARDGVGLFGKLKDDISGTSEVGNALISYIRAPYLSGYNSFLYSSCTNKFVISNFDAFAYLFFLIIILYFLRFL